MPHCELCGKETELVLAEVEGTEMSVCQNCAKFGQLKERPKAWVETTHKFIKKPTPAEPHLEITENLVPDYAQRIRKAREKLGLKQEEFAKKINEKESLVHKMETSEFEPSLPLARKLEKLLNIHLVEKVEEKKVPVSKEPSEGFTLGDFIKK